MVDNGYVNIHGKQYETVASRVQKFREKYKEDYGIITELISATDDRVVMKASIHKGDLALATGYAEEVRSSSQINRTSALENCETSAIGRALAAFGMAGTEYASADEVAQAISQQQSYSPAKTTLSGMASDKQRETIKKELEKIGIAIEDQKRYLIDTYEVEVPLTKEGASIVIGELFEAKGYAKQPA